MLPNHKATCNFAYGGRFNGANKMVYATRMLEQARNNNLMPEEVFSECNKMADDATLTKVLTYDVI